MRRLVIRPGAIGDFILSLPAIECLRTESFEVWTPSRTVPLVRFADRVRSIASTGVELVGVADTSQELMDEMRTFDSIVSWYGSNRAEFREAVAGLPFTFLRALPGEECTVHATDFYLEQVGELCSPLQAGGPRYVGGQGGGLPHIDCETEREDYAVIHPFSGSPRKNWGIEKFRAMAEKLPMPVRWCAGEDDPPLDGAVRIDDLYELACFLARARLFIGNDSGITHLAAAAGTPTLAIFGPTNPDIWGPRGDHVRIVRANMESKR